MALAVTIDVYTKHAWIPCASVVCYHAKTAVWMSQVQFPFLNHSFADTTRRCGGGFSTCTQEVRVRCGATLFLSVCSKVFGGAASSSMTRNTPVLSRMPGSRRKALDGDRWVVNHTWTGESLNARLAWGNGCAWGDLQLTRLVCGV